MNKIKRSRASVTLSTAARRAGKAGSDTGLVRRSWKVLPWKYQVALKREVTGIQAA